MLDRITLSLLTEFSSEFSLEGEEDDRFEQFTGWLAVCRHLSTTSFKPIDLWTEGGGDTGIDAIGIVVNNNLITDVDEIDDLLEVNGYLDVAFVFVQSERSSNFDSAKIGTFGNGVRDFFGQGKMHRNKKIAQFVEIMNAIYSKGYSFKSSNPSLHLYYITTGNWNNEDKNLTGRRDSEVELLKQNNQFGDVTFTPVGAPEIQHLYHLAKNAVKKQFLFQDKVLLPEVEGVSEAYLGFLPAKEYVGLVRDDGSLMKGLFYENVRDFEGYNEINKGIKETLSNETKDRFVVMNNGVTIIVRGELKRVRDNFIISDFYVVNGCQTTYVLNDNYDLITDKVHVPVRLIATKDEDVFEDVIGATNRQTDVKDHQFFATRKFAKQLEAYFRTFPVDKRLYYERRANQYASEEINEKRRIITHEDLIRSVGAMFFNYAHVTTKDFRSLKEKVGTEMFLETDRNEPYYVSALCLYKCEPLFGKKLDPKYKAARYQILYTTRLLMDNTPLPYMNSHNMGKRCNTMMEILWDDKKAEKLFLDAAQLIETIGGDEWDRESIRTERFNRIISERLGGKYGKREEQ